MPTELSRRFFLQAAAAAATLPLVTVRANAAGDIVLDIVSDGDTNITDWWTNTLAPMFQSAADTRYLVLL